MKSRKVLTSLIVAGALLVAPATANAMSKKSINYWSHVHYVRLNHPITIKQYKIKKHTISKITSEKHLKRGRKVYVALDPNAKNMWNVIGNGIRTSKNKIWFTNQKGTKWVKRTKLPHVKNNKNTSTSKIPSYWNQARLVQLTKSVKVYQFQIKNHSFNKVLQTKTLKPGYKTQIINDPNANGFWNIGDKKFKSYKNKVWFIKQNNTNWMKEFKIQLPTYHSHYQIAKDDIPSDSFVNGYLPAGTNLKSNNSKSIDSNHNYQFKKENNSNYLIQANGQTLTIKNSLLSAPISTKQSNVETAALVKYNIVYSNYSPDNFNAIVPANFQLKDGLRWIISDSAKKQGNLTFFDAFIYNAKQNNWTQIKVSTRS